MTACVTGVAESCSTTGLTTRVCRTLNKGEHMTTLKVPYTTPFWRAFFNSGTTQEHEEALDRSAPPEYWEAALSKNDLRTYRAGKLEEILPWLKEKT